jgi:hypothetical protein
MLAMLGVLAPGAASASYTYIEYQAGPATATSTPASVWSPGLWGWSDLNISGATGSVGGVVNDANSGMNAWRVTDSVAALPNPAQVTEILEPYIADLPRYGWRYSATARFVTDYGGGPDVGLAAYLGGRVYHLMFDLASTGALQATLTDETTRTYLLTPAGAGAAAYHQLQLENAPGSSVVTFVFDGHIVDRTWDGISFSHANTIQWGGDNQGGALARGEMNFQQVSFDVGPFTPGDFDGNGVADGRDFVFWQQGMNSNLDRTADGNGDGKVDQADLVIWRQNFGNSGVATASAAAPEPACAGMIPALCASLAHSTRHVRRRFREIAGTRPRPGQ